MARAILKKVSFQGCEILNLQLFSRTLNPVFNCSHSKIKSHIYYACGQFITLSIMRLPERPGLSHGELNSGKLPKASFFFQGLKMMRHSGFSSKRITWKWDYVIGLPKIAIISPNYIGTSV